MIKQLALFLLLLTAPAFSQGVGGGGVPGGPSSGSSSVVSLFQVAPNLVYTFTQPGDQSCTPSTGQVKDISGSGNNATVGASAPTCTGTGMSFGQNNVVSLPAAVNGNLTWCAHVSLPLYGQSGPPSGLPNYNFLLSSATINTAGISWMVANNSGQIYQQQSYSAAGGILSFTYDAEAGTHTECWLQGTSGNSTHDRFFTDGVEVSQYGSQNSQSGGGQSSGNLVIGQNNFSQPGFFYGTIDYLVGWSTQVTAAQVIAFSNIITQAAGAHGVAIKPTAELISTYPPLLAIGDSITDGYGATTPWTANMTLTGTYTIINEGFYGITMQSQLGQIRWRDAPKCASGYYKSLALIFAGTNDMTNGTGAAGTYAYIQSAASLLNAAGCQVGVVTMLSRTGQDASKDALNPLIRAGAATGGYFVVDPASVPLLGADGAYAGADFQGDGVHPNQTGENTLGATISNAVNAYGQGSASQSNPNTYSTNALTMISGDRFVTQVPTAAATATLPDCLGVTGTRYSIFNASAGANTITFSGKASEAISGSATLAQNLNAVFQATLISQAAAGCGWQRTQ